MTKSTHTEPMPWANEVDQNSGPYEIHPGDYSSVDDIDDETAALFLGMVFIVAVLIVALIFISVMFFA